MRWVIALLLITPAASALLDDPQGDVAVEHCEAMTTPLQGFDAMDLLALEIEELPEDIIFRVKTSGLAQEAGHDAGNYLVHFRLGQKDIGVRMYQDTAGSAAYAQLLYPQGLSLYGTVTYETTAFVNSVENTIEATIPRLYIRDHEQAAPERGRILEGISVFSEAHATGLYGCDLDGGTGPAIVGDRMPEEGADSTASFTMKHAGTVTDGPIDLRIGRPIRSSNGEATRYEFKVQVTNLDTVDQAYNVSAAVPAGWSFSSPPGRLKVPAGETEAFSVFASVPFVHEHGAIVTGELYVRTEGASASGDFGVYYLRVPQPSGHHPVVYIHSVGALGQITAFNAARGNGDHAMYWNTIEDDPADHGLAMNGQIVDGDIVWFGCLTPGLAMGLHPDLNRSGQFDLTFNSDIAIGGTLTGAISILPDDYRPATCHNARDWLRTPVLQLDPTEIDLDGASSVQGEVSAILQEPWALMLGSDLLLEIRITPDVPLPVGGIVALETAGTLRLPLLDYHEPVPTVPTWPAQNFETPTPTATATKDSPAPPLGAVLLAVGALALRRRALK